MPRTWRALPLTSDPRIHVKAPTYEEFLEQEHDMKVRHGFYLPRQPHVEYPIAAAMMDAVPDFQEIKPGEKYELWRYPRGLAVKGPSGWTFMMPLEVAKKGKEATGGGEPAEGEPEPAKKRARAKS